MNLSRRGFLRAIGVTATSIAMPTLWIPGQGAQNNVLLYGHDDQWFLRQGHRFRYLPPGTNIPATTEKTGDWTTTIYGLKIQPDGATIDAIMATAPAETPFGMIHFVELNHESHLKIGQPRGDSKTT